MPMRIFILILVVLLSNSMVNGNENRKHQTVNTVIGDISYTSKFNTSPNESTNEIVRIKTHLEYVENLLRTKNVDELSASKKENRTKLLDLLHNYRVAGIFPLNFDFPGERKPCFIDKEGNICAVGYLIEQTSSREIAEKINAKFQYEYLLAMNDKTVDDWISESGLTKEECAMIQPGYGYREEPVIVATPAYTVSWTPAPTKLEIKLQKKLETALLKNEKLTRENDSIEMILANQIFTNDSLNKTLSSTLNSKNEKIKSLTDENEKQIGNSKNNMLILSLIGFAGILFAGVQSFRIRKLKVPRIN